MGPVASQITRLTIVYSAVYSAADQRKHQSSASLAFVRGIPRSRWIVNDREAGDLRRNRAHYDVSVMIKTIMSEWMGILVASLQCSRRIATVHSPLHFGKQPCLCQFGFLSLYQYHGSVSYTEYISNLQILVTYHLGSRNDQYQIAAVVGLIANDNQNYKQI